MKIAITGGTGFVGGHLARRLTMEGHQVAIIARGADQRDRTLQNLSNATFHPIGTGDEAKLTAAFAGCDALLRGNARWLLGLAPETLFPLRFVGRF
jgi:nucleoside-diphosphate-sugar epimerase